MFGAILMAANTSFQKGMTICRSIYVKKVMKLLAFIFKQPSYLYFMFVFIISCWERADLLAHSCVMLTCVFSLSHMVSQVRCGT